MKVDLASQTSVRTFCSEYRRVWPGLDLLIHNAGCFNHSAKTYQLSEDGLELTFAVNVFNPYLMTQLLLDRLTESSDPRILTANSTNIKHFFDPKRSIDFENLRGEYGSVRPYSAYKMYGDSKMALLLLTIRMAKEYRRYGIKVNSLMIPATHVSKKSLRKMRGAYRMIGPLIQNLNPWAMEPEQIADCYYRVSVSPEFRHVSGALFDSNLQVIQPPSGRRIPGFIKRMGELWNTRHLPPYAAEQKNVDRLWKMANEVASE